ncbi:GNAT family N-acetyltransferase [Paenibacillus tianjinensis]|uniref:GNAT family N-acetyltransferase n=1 Tax=Paenibacillus tianjinensis TaxID=2810347 RepID=A0ABX7L8Y8_9BACL|nr:GNAT family N-acetyltransferase [Paenibacillus tianjinensis]QSF44652.1 GNAT family N-acetyltransferase [Paenibacillus tianjinensis]
MEIRQLQVEEFEPSLTLSEYAFKYTVSGEDRLKQEQKFKPERVWGIFEDGKLSAKLTLLPLQAYIQGQAISMGGIAGVATWPENRRQGYVAKLLKHILQVMNENGQTLSMLHPFLIPFYRKFGWEIYCEYKKYTIPVAKFPLKTDIEGSVRRDSANLEVLDQLYNQFAAQYSGTLLRTKEWWQNNVLDKDTHHSVFFSEQGEAEGYVLYKLENNQLVIDEFVFLNEKARRGLWTFLANHDSMVTGAELKLVPSDDILPFLLPDPRIPQENYPYFMARIVNAQAFVEAFSFNMLTETVKHTVYIQDEQAPWNEGVWEWTVNNQGAGSLTRLDSTDMQADLSCSIGTLTVLLMGYKRPQELARYGRISGSAEAVKWLEEITPQAKTALFDFF